MPDRYLQAIQRLYATQRTGIKLGLENTRKLLGLLGNPERAMRFVHVAGTNGKGSVCAFLAAGLRACGVKTGLFTSPHLIRFGERIQVDGEPISEAKIVEGLDHIFAVLAQEPDFSPTFFELTTALGLCYFQNQGVQIAVLETGMGGRLDSTNVVDPLVSVITRIDLDHTQWLGDSIEAIAAEKGGIIKQGRPVISLPQAPAAEEVLRQIATERGAPFELCGCFDAPLDLAGSHQKWNAGAAFRALELCEIKDFDPVQAAEAMQRAEWPARFQYLKPEWVLDGAHNPAAIARLVETWRERFGSWRPTVIFGALKDKNTREMIELLRPLARRFIFCPVKSERAAKPEELLSQALSCGITAQTAANLQAALTRASETEDPVLITGSLFLAGEVLAFQEARSLEVSTQ